MILNKWIDQIGDWNPQLFRELKGRVTAKSLGLMVLASSLVQGLVVFAFFSALPSAHQRTSPFCHGSAPAGWDPNQYPFNSDEWCLSDAMGHLSLDWPFWWMQMFLTLSLIGFFALLLGGTYLLIQDLGKEQKQGTLNFVTLSPQPAIAIAIGKILGVPIFLYGVVGFALPLHFWAGFRGGIPLHLLAMFYGVVAACCLFVFSGALLYGLVGQGGAALKAWLATGALFYFSSMSTVFLVSEQVHVGNLFDGFFLFNPLHLLSFLVKATAIAHKVDWFQHDNISEIAFFRVYLWNSPLGATLAHLVIYGVGIYWFAQAFKRKFHNAQGTMLSKQQSYILTASLTIVAIGFTLQEPLSDRHSEYLEWLVNFMILVIWGLIYLVMLVPVLSPDYQSIQDWSRYQQNTPKEWLFGERSPAFWAIAVNTLIAFVPSTIAGLLLMGDGSRWFFAMGMILQASITMIIATLGLWALLSRHRQRTVGAGVLIAASSILPLIAFGIAGLNPGFGSAAAWLWTIVPLATVQFASNTTIVLTMLGQLVTIAFFYRLIQGRLNRLAASELKQVLATAPGTT